MTSIFYVTVVCPECGWCGVVRDCAPDVDGDGSLGCPDCLSVVTELQRVYLDVRMVIGDENLPEM